MNATLTLHRNYRVEVENRELGGNAEEWLGRAKTAALLVAAPLIGLVYAVAFPFVGLAMLVWMGFRALPKRVKNILLFFAAPFIGLAYAVVFPFVGLGMVVWAGARAVK